MATVSKLLADKSAPEVATIRPDQTALDAARVMNERRIGSLLVTDERGRLQGIFTERDLLTRVVAKELAPSDVRIADAMTTDVFTCTGEASLNELRLLMSERKIRHVPVIEDGKIRGMVSIGDLNLAEVREMSMTISYLEQYITTT